MLKWRIWKGDGCQYLLVLKMKSLSFYLGVSVVSKTNWLAGSSTVAVSHDASAATAWVGVRVMELKQKKTVKEQGCLVVAGL